MGTPAERRALTALAALVALGAGVQVAQAHQIERAPLAAREQPALDAQLGAIDSARLRQGHRNRGLAPAAGAESRPGGRPAGRRRDRGAERPVGVQPRDAAPVPAEARATGPVDVDGATQAELEALPGIGPTLAKRIIEDRNRRGPFHSMEGFQRVKGVGPGLARKLAGRITFGGAMR